MFDVIGKRRWFYALSALLTIPGLIFILISPFSDAGLQPTIDYTGGTRWEIKFADPNVTPAHVEEIFAANDLDATAIRTASGYTEIKTEPIGLAPQPSESPAPSASPSPSASPAPSGSPTASGSPNPSESPSPAPIGNTELPRDGKLGEMVTALEARLGEIESQRSLTTIGAVVSSDLL